MMDIVIEIEDSEQIAYYGICDQNGKYLISKEEKKENKERFLYFKMSAEELESLTVLCYDDEENIKYKAFLDAKRYEIYVLDKQ